MLKFKPELLKISEPKKLTGYFLKVALPLNNFIVTAPFFLIYQEIFTISPFICKHFSEIPVI